MILLLLACAPPLVAPEVVEDPDHDWDLDGQTEAEGDCDDAQAAVGAGFTEVCDGLDNDCDRRIDEDDAADAVTWYQDLDGDGFGFGERAACSAPRGFVATGGDCNDQDASIHPDAAEVCDDRDNDCDGTVDGGSADATWWYADSDGDGYGDPDVAAEACEAAEGYVDNDADCDDTSDAAYPGHPELCGDGLDNDCSGEQADVCLGDDVGDAQRLPGEAGGEQTGAAVFGAGDMDGDGLEDVLVASPGRDTTEQQSGALELFTGPVASGTTLADAAWTLAGDSKNAEFGTRVALDGDRMWIGSPGHRLDSELLNVGAAYLVEGPPSETRVSDAASAWIIGEASGDRLGSSVAFLGDQLALGAPGSDWADENPGVVHLLEPIEGELASGAVIWGEGEASYTGYALAVGDLDGDGLEDVAIGAPGRRTWGSVYVVHGPVSSQAAADGAEWEGPDGGECGASLAALDLVGDGRDHLLVGAPGTGQVFLDGAALLAETGAGASLSSAGDLDADGTADLLVGADGAAWVVWGGPEPTLGPQLAWTEGALEAVAGVGDLDGDGHRDLAVGAPQHGDGDEGVVLLLRGASDGCVSLAGCRRLAPWDPAATS